MSRKNKKTIPPIATPQVENVNPLDTFELKKPEPVVDENGEHDYFTEYYNAYKNDYITQYLDAYRQFKEDGKLPEYSPFGEGEEEHTEPEAEIKDEIDV